MECAEHTGTESLLKQNLKFDELLRLSPLNCRKKFISRSLCLCVYVTWLSRTSSLRVITQMATQHFIYCHLKDKTVT
jgi:hypothetical protein